MDTSGIDLNLNKQKHRIPNEELEDKDYKWGFDGNEFFIDFKLAFAMGLIRVSAPITTTA